MSIVSSKSKSKAVRSRAAKYGIIIGNTAILVMAIALVGLHFTASEAPRVMNQQATVLGSTPVSDQTSLANPLDELYSVDIAVNVARAAGMQEQIPITNQIDTLSVTAAAGLASSDSVASKPQIVATNFASNKDIKQYTVADGDTLTSIAAQFGVTSDSIRWSNDNVGEVVATGRVLTIPPMSAIVYTVKDGDTPDKLAQTYKSNAQQIIAYNDAELTGLKPGDRILIPGGTKPAPVSYSYRGYYGFAFGSSAIYGYNGYIPGYCTWYVASRISVPANWGNASTWASGARNTAGWAVGKAPVAGSIAQNSYMAGGFGHVAVVEQVSADGSQIMISDMNFGGRWSKRTNVWVSTSEYQNFIYHQ